ncbi:MAG TPA: twin-arginine translocation signal domain-containing protein [Opitutaceae bacterium]|jgi:hypothetical protein|nr:twin-arginine translocation signal domain-containing protein [Opitutaceae bacterium]
MSTPRRDFLKSSLALSAATVLPATASAAPAQPRRDWYELRAYRLKSAEAPAGLLHGYLEKALLPACNRIGAKPVGVFTEIAPKEAPAVWVLIPHATLDSFVATQALVESDPALQAAGAAYLQTPKTDPAFERIDSWLLQAFTGMPVMEIPEFSRTRQPKRIFELRMYESYSEERALRKIAMFNEGEIDVMRRVGLAPLFFGQAMTGPNLPHLTYITGAADPEAHQQHWKGFRDDPQWAKMKVDPRYADTVSKNTPRMLAPTAYSQI